jgi:YD repeat-containing protein
MTKAGVMDMEYRYTVGQNNGRIWQSKDHVTGEEVTYQYDSLNRLTRAETTDNAWGNAYTYDGWGNLTGKSVTKGTAPTYSQAYDPALNMPVGSNPPSHTAPYPHLEPYDIEDRTLYGKAEATPDGYGGMEHGRLRYEPSGRKLFWNKDGESGYPNPTERCEIYFYSITGQRLARYKCAYNQDEYEGPYRFGVWLVDRNQHIGGATDVGRGEGGDDGPVGVDAGEGCGAVHVLSVRGAADGDDKWRRAVCGAGESASGIRSGERSVQQAGSVGAGCGEDGGPGELESVRLCAGGPGELQ